jgi:hypothetical protein
MAVRAVSPLGLAGLTRTPSRIAAGDSGLAHVQTKPVTASLNLPNASHALEMMKEAFGAYRAVVADLSDAEKSKAWNEVYACLKQFEGVGGFATQFEFVIGVGAKAVLSNVRF